ncbi:MAG: prephenate dehydratase [Gammaproteobacteria bacterium]|nr:prephenate dehydratase [Gammaproteobacteria bacterium]
MSTEQRIGELRVMIDAVDDELLQLLNRRAALTMEVGEVKRGSGTATEFYRPEREARILRRLLESNPGPLPDEDLVRVMREIISTCLSLEHALRVAYLGPEGTYTHAAVMKHFGGAIEPVASTSVGEVFREVEARACDYGVVPIENSVGGSINQTLDCLAESGLRICAEVVLAVHHQLLSNASTFDEVQRVYAHEQALAQCRGWLDRHLPAAERIAFSSNAAAAQRARAEAGSAAIASVDAGRRYGLTALASNIEDFPHNTTRFAVLGRAIPRDSGDDVTTVMFGLPNKAGALHAILSVLAERGISMTRIESRPARNGVWDYLFFVDLLGHSDDPVVAAALAEIENRASLFKLLGSYPRAIL